MLKVHVLLLFWASPAGGGFRVFSAISRRFQKKTQFSRDFTRNHSFLVNFTRNHTFPARSLPKTPIWHCYSLLKSMPRARAPEKDPNHLKVPIHIKFHQNSGEFPIIHHKSAFWVVKLEIPAKITNDGQIQLEGWQKWRMYFMEFHAKVRNSRKIHFSMKTV